MKYFAKIERHYREVKAAAPGTNALVRLIEQHVTGDALQRFVSKMSKQYGAEEVIRNLYPAPKDLERQYAEAKNKEQFLVSAVRQYIPQRLKILSDLMRKVMTWKNGHLVVYRRINVADVESFLSNLKTGKGRNLGIYWSWNPHPIDTDVSGGEGAALVLVGLVPMSAIDFPSTAYANMNVFGSSDENEITLRKGAAVEVIGVLQGYEGDNLWRGSVQRVAQVRQR